MSNEYWANISMNGSGMSYLFLYFVASGTRITATVVYYFKWTEKAQPMPLGGYITGSVAFLAIVIAVILRLIMLGYELVIRMI